MPNRRYTDRAEHGRSFIQTVGEVTHDAFDVTRLILDDLGGVDHLDMFAMAIDDSETFCTTRLDCGENIGFCFPGNAIGGGLIEILGASAAV